MRGSLAALNSYSPNSEATIHATTRPRVLFLPHYPLTIHALLHFLYTSSLPDPTSPLSTPQVLCSLLQIARPYKIDGLLEAVVERLHTALDSRNTAAIFNAAAMAAGGGDGVEFFRCEPDADKKGKSVMVPPPRTQSLLIGMRGGEERENGANGTNGKVGVGSKDGSTSSTDLGNLPRLNTDVSASGPQSGRPQTSHSMSGASASEDEFSTSGQEAKDIEVWSGSLSAVVGLQKRGLRGLMEGRRIREMGSRDTGTSAASGERVGLGIG
jgi:hypothetical protein